MVTSGLVLVFNLWPVFKNDHKKVAFLVRHQKLLDDNIYILFPSIYILFSFILSFFFPLSFFCFSVIIFFVFFEFFQYIWFYCTRFIIDEITLLFCLH